MFVMKKQIVSRPLTFLANLLRFAVHIKQSFDLFSITEAYIPELKDKSLSINV